MRNIKQLTFEEALKHAQNRECVYTINIGTKEPVLKKFEMLTFNQMLKGTFLYFVIETNDEVTE